MNTPENPRTTVHAPLAALLLTLTAVAAQDRPPAGILDDALVPIQSAAAGGVDADHGLWARGRGYKVSFHDGFAFYPDRDADSPHTPFRWHTESVTAGGQELLAAGEQPELRPGELRCEYRYGAVVEAYDLRPEGVEQSFTIHRRPAVRGDLVVTGRVETELVATPVADVHGPLTFHDATGRATLRYGAAIAFDAVGRRIPLTTSYGENRIRLRVPGDWLETAEYPVTIDPLTTPVALRSSSSQTTALDVAQGRAILLGDPKILVVEVRRAASGDHDLYGWVFGPGYTGRRLVFSRISASSDAPAAAAAFVSGALRWVIAYEVEVGGRWVVNTYFHDFSSATANSGSTLSAVPPSGTDYRNPDVGGAAIGVNATNAIVVFERVTGGIASVAGRVFDVANASPLGGVFGLDRQLPLFADQRAPTVNQLSDGDSSWIACWQERGTLANTDWVVEGSKISRTGTVVRTAVLADSGGSRHVLQPAIAGTRGRYLFAYGLAQGTSNTTITELRVRRLDWSESPSSNPVIGPLRTIDSSSGGLAQLGGAKLAFDTTTLSHWAIVYPEQEFRLPSTVRDRLRYARLGHSGAVTESGTLYGGPYQAETAAVTYDRAAGDFATVYADRQTGGSVVFGTAIEYPPAAASVVYGTGCGGRISADRPYAGHEFFEVRLSAGQLTAAAFLLVALAPGSTPLDPLGMPGCVLNIAASPAPMSLTVPMYGGSTATELALPDQPLLTGDVYFQWGYLDVNANALGVGLSEGLRAQIR